MTGETNMPQQEGNGLYKVLKFVGVFVGALVVVVLLAGLAGGVWLSSPVGREWLAESLSERLDTPSRDVHIGAIEGSPFSVFSLKDSWIADEKGKWLEAPLLTIDWSPLSLLGGNVLVRRIDGEAVTVHRAPEEGETGRDLASAGLPSVSLRLEEAAIPLLYQKAPYSLTVQEMQVSPGFASGDVALNSADESDMVRLSMLWDKTGAKATRGFTLTGNLIAKPGSLIGDMLRLVPGDALKAGITGAGTIAAWKSEFHVGLADKLSVKGTGHGEGPLWHFQLSQQNNSLLPDALQPFLGAGLDVTLDMEMGDIIATRLQLNSSETKAHLLFVGDLNPEDGLAQQGELSLQLPEYSYNDVHIKDISIQGKVDIGQAGTQLRYQAVTSQLRIADISLNNLTVNGGLVYAKRTLTGAVGSAAFHTRYGTEAMAMRAENGHWQVAFDDSAWQASLSDLQAEGFKAHQIEVSGTAGMLETASGSITAAASVLQPWVGGIVTAGNVGLHVFSERQDAITKAEVSLGAAGLDFKDDRLTALIGASPEAKVTLLYDGATIELQDLAVKGNALDAEGGGILQADGSDMSVSLSGLVTATEGLLGDALDLNGNIRLQATLEGSFQEPKLKAQAGVATVGGYNMLFDQPTIDAYLARDRTDKNIWTGTVQLKADSGMGPLSLHSKAAITEKGFFLKDVSLALPGVEGTGDFKWSDKGDISGYLDSRIIARTVESQQLQPSGVGSLGLVMVGTARDLQMELTVEAVDAVIPRRGVFPLNLAKAEGTLRLGWQSGLLSYDANLDFAGVTYGAQKLDTISVRGSSALNTPLEVRANGYWDNKFSLAAAFSALSSADGVQAPRSASLVLDMVYGGVGIKTGAPLMLDWSEGLNATFSALEIAKGQAEGRVYLSAETQEVDLKIQSADLSFVNIFRPGLLKAGDLTAGLHYRRIGGVESGTGQVTLGGIQLASGGLVQDEAVYAASAHLALQDGTIKLESVVGGKDQVFGRFSAEFPYERDGITRAYRLRAGVPFYGELDWQGDVTPLWLLARQPSHLLSGMLEGQLRLSGTLETPIFEGRLDLKNGSYEYEPLGMVAVISRLTATGTQDRLELTELTATDGEGGGLSGSGYLELSPHLSFPGELMFTMKDFKLARQDHLNGKASSDLVYRRAEGSATLTGKVRTGHVQVAMPRELPRSVIDIDVIEINNRSLEKTAMMQELGLKSALTALDVSITIPKDFHFQGRGLTSEWGGTLRLTGSTSDPRLNGTMKVITGSFQFGTKVFAISDGSLMFRAGRGFDPILSVTAVHRAADLEARLLISGQASAPTITLTSTPALPEDEIMSRILFGRSVTDISALQLAEVALAINTLRGGGQLDLAGQLRRRLGLDTLSFSSDEHAEGSTLVRGGKYIRDNIYLEVETSTASSETSTRLKIDLTKNLLVETEVGPRQGSSLSLKWFWDY